MGNVGVSATLAGGNEDQEVSLVFKFKMSVGCPTGDGKVTSIQKK